MPATRRRQPFGPRGSGETQHRRCCRGLENGLRFVRPLPPVTGDRATARARRTPGDGVCSLPTTFHRPPGTGRTGRGAGPDHHDRICRSRHAPLTRRPTGGNERSSRAAFVRPARRARARRSLVIEARARPAPERLPRPRLSPVTSMECSSTNAAFSSPLSAPRLRPSRAPTSTWSWPPADRHGVRLVLPGPGRRHRHSGERAAAGAASPLSWSERFAHCQRAANGPFTGAAHRSTMQTDWAETPGDAAMDATRRAAGGSAAPTPSSEAGGIDDDRRPGTSTRPTSVERQVGRNPAGEPETVSETDLLYWFG
jgi:hypothetical protein